MSEQPSGAPAACGRCQGTGTVCECHPERPWGRMCCDGPTPAPRGVVSCAETLCEHGACHCGGAGMPCWACPLPAVALEPGTLPEHPLRAMDCPALLAKEIGLGGQPQGSLQVQDAAC